jgi:hypothetical protein
MRLLYIISAYTQPDLLVRLVTRLSTEEATFMIHVDRRTDGSVFDRMVRGVARLPNVHFLERHRCSWGDFGHVRATLKGIDAAFEGGVDFDYAVLLTGQDYPIKSNNQILQFFERNRGRSYMANFALPTTEWTGGGLDRIERWHLRLRGRHFAVPIPRSLPAGMRPFGGSSYWCLTRQAVEYVRTFVGANRAFVEYFKHVDVPDELFFQTILMNSPYASEIVDDDLRYIDWKTPDAGSPAVLGVEDFPALQASDKLFARKFDEDVDAVVLDKIDREILRHPDSADET